VSAVFSFFWTTRSFCFSHVATSSNILFFVFYFGKTVKICPQLRTNASQAINNHGFPLCSAFMQDAWPWRYCKYNIFCTL
jgi:hypothetical protein